MHTQSKPSLQRMHSVQGVCRRSAEGPLLAPKYDPETQLYVAAQGFQMGSSKCACIDGEEK